MNREPTNSLRQPEEHLPSSWLFDRVLEHYGVAIGPALQRALEDCRNRARLTGLDDFVFAVLTNTPIDLHNVMARYIKPACVKLGIPLVSWHDLRHTYTTWGRKAGVKAETMRDQLGHVSVQITLDVYSHTDDKQAEAGVIESYALPDYGTLHGTPADGAAEVTH